MNNRILQYGFLFFVVVLTACGPRRNLVYFSNMDANTTVIRDSADNEVHIKKGDIVNITLNSLSPESDMLFASNKGLASDGTLKRDGYMVSKDGTINIPIVGEFKIAGMTIDEAEDALTAELSKRVKNPQVVVTIVNFKITVVGEVNKPNTFIIPDDKVNVLEALGMAGDMTVFGKRNNVLVIRTNGSTKTMKRLDLNDKSILHSPYFYLKQNDIVYVEPDKSKSIEYDKNIRILPVVSAAISAMALVAAVLLKR